MITASDISSAVSTRPSPTGGGVIGEPAPTPVYTFPAQVIDSPSSDVPIRIGVQPVRTNPAPKAPVVIVNYTNGGDNSGGSTGPAAATPVPEAKSSLNDAITALGALFASMQSTSPTSSPASQPVGTVQVSQQPTDTTSSGSTGKSVIIIAGLVIGLGYLGYHAYKAGWLSKKKGKETPKEE